jgi:hypothetical protein
MFYHELEKLMSVRRFLTSLSLVLVTAACAENLSSPASLEQGPRFLKWTTTTRPEFAFIGANAVGSRFAYVSVPTPAVVDQSSSTTASTASLSWSHSVGNGANRLLVVGVSIRNAGKTVTGVSYSGKALTFLQARNNHDAAVRVEQWYLIAPPAGTGTVTVTLSGSAKVAGGAVSFTGADQVSPFRGLMSNGSTNTGTDNPTVADSSGVAELVVGAVATEGDAGVSLTPMSGQSQAWKRVYGNSGGDIAGAASTTAGAAGLVVGWTKSVTAKWAIAAAVVKPAPSVALTQYQATLWAKRGQARTLQINYAAGGGTSPFMKLTISDPTYAPGRGDLAVGDSVLVTATVDPNSLTMWLEPHQLQFGSPAQLQLWYGGAGGDLNGDGVVNSSDSYIESQLLGLWYQADPSSPWYTIPATQSTSTKSFTAALQHFSGYSVAW